MKSLYKILRDYIKSDFHIVIYTYTILLLSLFIFLNYRFDFEDGYMDQFKNSPTGILIFSSVNFIGYFAVIIPILLIRKKNEILRNPFFWLKSLFFLTLIGLERGYHFYPQLTRNMPYYESRFINKVFSNLETVVVYIGILLLFKWLTDREKNHAYGLARFKNARLNVFVLMILLLIPLVAWASFQPDFINTYPRFKPWNFPELFGFTIPSLIAIFETSYGMEFIAIELIYRGALVIGMASLLGKDAILPMVSVYVIIHFGKPMAECTSSFFGGYALGVFALYLRSIWGGIIVHMGLAYLMEVGAYLSYHLIFKTV